MENHKEPTMEDLNGSIGNPVKLIEYGILDYPFELSEAQKYILNTFYDPDKDYKELCIVGGRKGLKTGMNAAIVLTEVITLLNMEPTPQSHYGMLPTQKIFIMVVATDTIQARDVTFGWIKSLAYNSWYLSNYIIKETKDELHFAKNIVVTCKSCSAKAGRGYHTWMNVYDEIGWFMNNRGNNSGDEVYVAYQPNLKVFRGDGKTVLLSSPAGKEGILWDAFRFGVPIHVVQTETTQGTHPWRAVFQYPTWQLNPTLPEESPEMQKEKLANPNKFKLEYGALFADAINQAIPVYKIRACAIASPLNLRSTDKKTKRIIALDPATSGDAYGLAMGHVTDSGKIRIDIIKQWSAKDRETPINVEEVENFARMLCERFNIVKIAIDQYQSDSIRASFSKEGRPIELTRFSLEYNAVIYENLIRLINEELIEYPNDDQLIDQLTFLVEKRSGRHLKWEAASGHGDDLCDCISNVSFLLRKSEPRLMWREGF